jgi:pseudouridine synthase
MEARLQKILSAAGVASRRAAERLIVEGRVSVNGAVVRELGTKADPARDDIRVDDRRVGQAAARVYYLLNKPRGYVTTRSDPEGRPTVLALMPEVHGYIYPVGRLDYDSEGLLILTNDGELAARLTHPSHEVPREYQARVLGLPDEHDVHRLSRGILLDGRRTAPAEVRLLKVLPGRTPHGLLSITLHEGRTRQVRRMFEAVGHPVVDLRRVRIGPIVDDRLKLGTYRPLSAREVEALERFAPPSPLATADRPRRAGGGGKERPRRPRGDRA